MKSLRSTQKLYRFKNALSEHLMEAQAAVNTIMIISLPKKTLSPKRPQKPNPNTIPIVPTDAETPANTTFSLKSLTNSLSTTCTFFDSKLTPKYMVSKRDDKCAMTSNQLC